MHGKKLPTFKRAKWWDILTILTSLGIIIFLGIAIVFLTEEFASIDMSWFFMSYAVFIILSLVFTYLSYKKWQKVDDE